MIRSCCLFITAAASLGALSACAVSGDSEEGGKSGYTSRGGNGGSGGDGFGGSNGSGGSGFGSGATGPGSGGGFGSGGTGFGGATGSGFGGTTGTGFGGTTGTGFGGTTGTGTGGTGGTGTAGTGSGAVPGVADLIDDLELGTGSIPTTNGRVGAWYTYNDGTSGGTQTPTAGLPFVPDPGGYNATKCARTHGSGFTVWGAGMGVDLNNNSGTKGTWDASSHQGLTFQAKGTKPFRIKVLIPATTPTAEGGTCTGAGCGNNHGFIVNVTADWAPYQVPFSSLAQEQWADMQVAEFSSAAVIGIQFQVNKDAGAFDFAIDNLGFY